MNELVLSVFPGIDLFGRAFEEQGYCVVRGPDLLWGGDIRTFHPSPGRFEGVIGGPPCQCFSSMAHLVRRNGHEPRFGNLIPEFERVVLEAQPRWFCMENVEKAPQPRVEGYAVHSFLLDNVWLGEEQRRHRRFSFGVRGREAVDLRRWIELAPLELPKLANGVLQKPVNNSQEAKGRVQTRTVCGGHGSADPAVQVATVTGSGGGESKRSDSLRVRYVRYEFAEMLRLQGLPADFFGGMPFTVEGKRQMVGNGVPLPMGRAVSKAVRAAERKP